MDIANGSLAKSNNWSLINRKKNTKKMLVNYIKKNTFAIIIFFFKVCFTYFKRNFPFVINANVAIPLCFSLVISLQICSHSSGQSLQVCQ